nr:putative reverse transcriptase domain-containing protein [Tanacetum cinerariifolium]
MRQHHWIELFSDYDCEICYHRSKADVVADALSRKERSIRKEPEEKMRQLMSAKDKEKKQEEIVVDFLEVFPDDLSGLLSDNSRNSRTKISFDQAHRLGERRSSNAIELDSSYLLVCITGTSQSRHHSVVRFGKKGKLAPRFVGPFEIIEKVGPVAYMLDFPEELDGVHDTFHVSNLKKCLSDLTLQAPLDEIRVDDKLNFVEEPVEIMKREFKKLKQSRIAIVKVRWNSKRILEFTWEHEDQMKLKLRGDLIILRIVPRLRSSGPSTVVNVFRRETICDRIYIFLSDDTRHWYAILCDLSVWFFTVIAPAGRP